MCAHLCVLKCWEASLRGRVADDQTSFATLRGPAAVIGHGIFIAPATTSDPGNALASRHSTTREVRLCQCCDFAAQGPQTGPYAVTLSLLKVNSPYQLVNNCKRASHGSGFTQHGHLLSCREFGDYGGGTICRS
jgi:hypothetical protein